MTALSTLPAGVTPPAATSSRHWTGADADGPWLRAARDLAPQLAQHSERHDRQGTFVSESIDLLRSRSLLSLLVPADLGGGGASHCEAGAVLAELARGCPATALAASMHTHLVAAQVWRQKRGLPAPLLARVAKELIFLVSTGASDWIDSNGTATKVDGGYRISARKGPASGAPTGAMAVTSVRWEDAPEGPHVLHLSVPFASAGVRVEHSWDALGMRGTGSDTVVFDDVFVPDTAIALVRPAGAWHPIWSTVLGAAMPLITATYVGVAVAAAEEALRLAAERRDPARDAALVGRLGNRLLTAQDVVRAMFEASNDLTFDNTLEHASTTLARKAAAADACLDVARLALELAGGAGFHRSNTLERLFRDLQGVVYHPLPSAQQERFSGLVALGLDPIQTHHGR
jgi:acyl-CoA dehydrogenase